MVLFFFSFNSYELCHVVCCDLQLITCETVNPLDIATSPLMGDRPIPNLLHMKHYVEQKDTDILVCLQRDLNPRSYAISLQFKPHILYIATVILECLHFKILLICSLWEPHRMHWSMWRKVYASSSQTFLNNWAQMFYFSDKICKNLREVNICLTW